MSSWRRVVGAAAGAVDRAVIHAMTTRSRPDARTLDERMALLDAVARTYAEAPDWLGRAQGLTPALRDVRPGVVDATWPSRFSPYAGDVASRYLARRENATARARLFLGRGRRPAVLAIHGYMGGYYALEEAAFPLSFLVGLGLDVALPVLPFHAQRAGQRRGAPSFPNADPRVTNEGFFQAVTDLVDLAAWLRERGAPAVGVMGMSLGGYTAALLATASDAFDFVAPIIPLASLADFARDQGRLGEGPEADALHGALERANQVVSPFARPLRIAPARALIVGAAADRVTPLAHAERLAAHFACELHTIPGGHLLQVGRRAAFERIGRMLEREGIVSGRR